MQKRTRHIIYGAGICFSNLYLISFLECNMAYVRELERAFARTKATPMLPNEHFQNILAHAKLKTDARPPFCHIFDKYFRLCVRDISQQLLHGI